MAANFLARVSCLTLSKAFARSSETIATYSLSSSIWVVCCWMLISADVVEPVGLNAYWSFRRLYVALSSKAGYMYPLIFPDTRYVLCVYAFSLRKEHSVRNIRRLSSWSELFTRHQQQRR